LFVIEPDFAVVGLDLESAEELPDFLPSWLAANFEYDTLEPPDRALHTLLEAHDEPFDAGGGFGAGVIGSRRGPWPAATSSASGSVCHRSHRGQYAASEWPWRCRPARVPRSIIRRICAGRGSAR